eukprot:CAMPEP_0197455436 /NCGR_PEP_ID=MMETSP1175-20131217/40801_1 /TAXON_ID=1003142 /ORGANISM="Triceratium dubium, Strain CCMP147" /LENGTH=60 /DNA_ID=CAMNT_0042989297 /DNA_START=8 /DNA_END=186 /DNA_ORIENTATION=-
MTPICPPSGPGLSGRPSDGVTLERILSPTSRRSTFPRGNSLAEAGSRMQRGESSGTEEAS